MTVNMGGMDRGLRALAAVVLIGVWFAKVVTGVLGVAALVVAVVLLATSTIGWCPAYLPFGISTKKSAG